MPTDNTILFKKLATLPENLKREVVDLLTLSWPGTNSPAVLKNPNLEVEKACSKWGRVLTIPLKTSRTTRINDHLLDTHTIIWFINGDSELSAKARKLIEKHSAANFVSVASLWEIAIKVSLGELELDGPFSEIKTQLDQNGFQLLPITWEDTLLIASLPFHHRDPFDRILVAQSINNNLNIITKDAQFKNYTVSLRW